MFQDEKVAAFRDRRPAALDHLQVIPQEHIKNIKSLELHHVPLLEHMYREGKRLLTEMHPGAEMQFGFHIPPFTSVRHLHLHCIALPFNESAAMYKYRDGDGMWIPYEKVLETLKNESKVIIQRDYSRYERNLPSAC